MINLGSLLALGTALALLGCSGDARKDAGRILRQVGAQPLRRDAGKLYKNLFAATTGQYFLVSLDKCPPTFRSFTPREVRAYPDGFALALRIEHGAEEGLYVVPVGMDREPRAAPSARFQRIDDGVYWYWFAR